ncbi:hypothetical protein D9758_013458 [Tetrapyrgos nigripes]|uniref:Uncharacterized protein n=1 Tax=Tetrapyrgos nigripes TaxID=182062 RepID=A0A8H5CRA0_9AGAR|nr:hypothetical protein D9758_013458 [Tetrapyrgos nigripes]
MVKLNDNTKRTAEGIRAISASPHDNPENNSSSLSLMSTVWRMVDDTDLRLSYQGDWNPLTLNATLSEQLSNGLLPNGPVFNRTLHEARSNVSVSFTFNGKFLCLYERSGFLGVYGSLDASGSFNPDDTQEGNPQVACSLDGIDIGSDEVANFLNFPAQGQGPVNNNLFCVIQGSSAINGKDSKFQPGEHVLQINVTNGQKGTMGWFFDYITFESMAEYVPVDGEVLQAGKTEVISNVTDYGMLSFPSSQGWNFDTFDLETFSGNHSNVTLTFNGTSVSLFAGLSGLLNNPFANGFYQVDNLDPVDFKVPILDSDFSNQLIWTADKLDSGPHTVLTSFNVSPHSDLQLGYFLVNAASTDPDLETTSSTSSTGVNPTQSTSTTGVSPTPSSTKQLGSGAIVGIVIGTCIPILILIGAVIFWRRSRRQQRVLIPMASSPLTPFSESYQDSPSAGNTRAFTASTYQSTSKGSKSSPVDSISPRTPSASVPGADRPHTENPLVMKLQQRLVVMEEQLQARQEDGQLDHHRTAAPIIHTDSGVRLTERLNAPEELPPGYTEQ